MRWSELTKLDEEVESWKGFHHVMRKDDRDTWDRMVERVRKQLNEAIESSGKTFTTDPFFMALFLVQHEMISQLRAELGASGLDSGERDSGNASPGSS